MYVISMQRKGLMARYLVILLHTADTKSNGFHTKLIIKGFDTWRHLAASLHGLKNSLSNPGATWLKDDFSSLCGWINREVRGEELRVSTRLQVGGGSNGSVHCECVFNPQVVCGCRVPSCLDQTDTHPWPSSQPSLSQTSSSRPCDSVLTTQTALRNKPTWSYLQ